MKNTMDKKNPYQTNRGGIIKAPTFSTAEEPKAEKEVGNDLRAGK